MRRAVMLVLVAACGRLGFEPQTGGDDGDGGIDAPPPPYEPTWMSGTRIKARVLRSPEGGDPMWLGWHDTQLGTLCASQPSADGRERCIPNELQLGRQFSDPACTQPLAVALDQVCGGVDRYAFDYDTMNQAHVYALGPIYTGQVYTIEGGPCTATGVSPTATVYTIGAEVAASTFIETRYVNVTTGSWTRVIAGFTDGAQQLLTSLGIPVVGMFCRPHLGGLSETPCIEQIPSLAPVYRDAACTDLAFLAPGPETETSFYVRAPTLCAASFDRYARGPAVTQVMHWVKGPGGTCTAQATGSGELYRGTLEANPFPRGTMSIGPRRGRIGKLFWTATDGTVLELATFDHELGVPCRPFRATDDKLRCLPYQPRDVVGFPSLTCGGPSSQLTGGCFASTPMHGPDYASCRDQGWAVLGYAPVGDAASAYVEDQCRPIATPPHGVHDFSQRTAEISPATFAEMIETIE